MTPKYDAEIVKSNIERLVKSLDALAKNEQAQRIVDESGNDIHMRVGTAKMMVKDIEKILDTVFVAIERSKS